MDPQQVTQKNLSEYVNYLINEFYRNNQQPYFDALAEDAVWYGPRQNQTLETKKVIIETFTKDQVTMQSEIGAIYTRTIPCGKQVCETMSLFDRLVRFPNGKIIQDRMCYHLSWVKRETWQMRVVTLFIRVTNPAQDKVYPHTLIQEIAAEPKTEMLSMREKGTANTVFLHPEDIEWAESAGHFCNVRAVGKSITVGLELRELEEKTNGILLRCHAGYLINPKFASSIRRFRVTMRDGVEIPVPEKRYTEVKRQMLFRKSAE